jgi:methylglyoxal synthase
VCYALYKNIKKGGKEIENQTLVALIAHDCKKEEIVQFSTKHSNELANLRLVATKSTGSLIESKTGLKINLMQSGPYGGDQQIGALVASGICGAVIFLRDPLTAQPHEPDITALLRVCDVHNIPVATNLTTAEAVLKYVLEEPGTLSEQQQENIVLNKIKVAC